MKFYTRYECGSRPFPLVLSVVSSFLNVISTTKSELIPNILKISDLTYTEGRSSVNLDGNFQSYWTSELIRFSNGEIREFDVDLLFLGQLPNGDPGENTLETGGEDLKTTLQTSG